MARKSLFEAVERYLGTALSLGAQGESADAEEAARKHLAAEANKEQVAAGRPFPRILVAVDRPQHPGLVAGFRLAEALGGRLAILHVADTTAANLSVGTYSTHAEVVQALRRHDRDVLEDCKGRVPVGVDLDCLSREGNAAVEIVNAAKEWKADIIIMGTHRRSALATFFLGSTSEAVIRTACSPVLLVADVTVPSRQVELETAQS